MLSVVELLPLLDGWVLRKGNGGPDKLGPGETLEMVKVRESGWLALAKMTVDNPYVGLRIAVGDPYGNVYEYSFRVYDAYEDGLVMPNPAVWLTRYDDEAKVYVLYHLGPTPYHGPLRIEAVNTLGRDVTVREWGYMLYAVVDEERFARSLQRLLGTAAQPEKPWYRGRWPQVIAGPLRV